MSLTNCRFYEEKYPEIDSFVMVNVKQVGFNFGSEEGKLSGKK
jgi:translation initiation factor 2 alpha subunit (eIF-2alpha)